MQTLGLGPFLGGLAMLCVTLTTALAAGHVAQKRFTPNLPPLHALLSMTLFATLAVIVEHGLPLALGVLSEATVLISTALVAGWALWTWLDLPPGEEVRGEGLSWAAVPLLIAGGAAAAFIGVHGGEATLSSDALNFQIPQLARWIDTGSMWQLDQFFPLYSNATYPQHGNLLLLSVVQPFDSAFLARFVPVPYAVLTCVGVYACARELGATPLWSALGAALPAALPILVKVAIDGAQTDMPLTFAVVVAALFLLRHRRTGARGDLVVAGLAVGLAAGTKWYALSALPPLLVAWGVAHKLAGASWRRALTDSGILLGVALVVASPWLIRNLVEAGNPLFPQPLGPFNAPRDIIREQAGFSLLDYATDGDVWDTYLLPQFDEYFAAPGYVLTAAPLVALLFALRRRAWAVVALSLGALGALLAYAATPYSAFGPKDMPILAFADMRYALPALLIGALAVAWVGTASRRLGIALAVGVAVAIGQGLITEYELPLTDVLTGVVALGAAIVVARRVPWPVVAAVVVLGGAALARDDYTVKAYEDADPTLAWLIREAPAGHRIGLAGVWSPGGISPVLPAFGPRLRNHVAFLGPFKDHLLHPETDPERFRDRLTGYDLLVVGRGITPRGPAPEEGWARDAGFEPVVESDRLALLRRTTS